MQIILKFTPRLKQIDQATMLTTRSIQVMLIVQTMNPTLKTI